MLRPETKKNFYAILAAILVLLPAFGCKSGPNPSRPDAEDEEPLCEPAYTQEEIDLELGKLKLLENRSDYPNDAAFANFRAIKTKGIQERQFFRSSHPALPGARAPYTARLAEQARIFTILNLSDTRAELVQHASAVPWYQNYLNRDAVAAMYTGMDYFEPYFGEKLKEGIQYMLHRRGPYLIHCDNGMDRTGFVFVLFEALVGAPLKEIFEDYMQSYVNYYGLTEDEESYRIISQIAQNFLCTMNRGRVVTDVNASQAAERYLSEIAGLDFGMIAELKERLAGN